jgi:hypothetical protein
MRNAGLHHFVSSPLKNVQLMIAFDGGHDDDVHSKQETFGRTLKNAAAAEMMKKHWRMCSMR